MATRQYKSRVYFSTATTGTGTLTVGAAETGYRLPTPDLDTKELEIIIEDGDAWEKSTGIYTHSGTTLTRTLVESSTGSLLALSGSAKVFIDLSDDALNNMYRLNNDVATTAPGVSNDNTEGYTVGSRWTNVTANNTYLCQDVTTGAAVWAQTDAAAGSGDLVSTSNLSDVDSAATSFANIKQVASATATGVVELATIAEVDTGTDTGRAITPAGLEGSALQTKVDGIEALAEVNDVTTLLGADIGSSVQAYDANNALTDVAQEFTATQNFNATTLTSTTNAVAWVASTNQVVTHTLTENTTFSAPSGLVDGAFYSLCIVQDASASSFTVAFNSVFKFTGGAAPTWTTTANARDYITFRSNGTNLYEVGHSLAVS